MAHRLAFPANRCTPLAVYVSQSGTARLTPYDPALPDDPHLDILDDSIEAQLDLLALDITPLDQMVPSQDTVSLKMTFVDKLGRRVQIDTRDVVLGFGKDQHYGGVATNLVQLDTTDEKAPLWVYQPMVAWVSCDIRVNNALTDSNVLGLITLTEQPSDEPVVNDEGKEHDTLPHALRFQILPKRIFHDAQLISTPLQAAEEVGMAGWMFSWNDASYIQAPVMTVRVERGDSFTKISKEMAVDKDILMKANVHLADEQDVAPGDLLRVPMILRATDLAPRKQHPSVALTWNEIVRGWTTLN